MDLRRLRHFVVAAEESNFRRAALRLDTNQSIISRHVRDIEEADQDTHLRRGVLTEGPTDRDHTLRCDRDVHLRDFTALRLRHPQCPRTRKPT
jgi:Bacterial regulatory helix-turn-helix protein, lysR family